MTSSPANRSPGPAPQQRPAVTLQIIAGPHRGEKFVIDCYDTLIIGRAKDAQWQMGRDRFFSRYHFRVEAQPPECRLEDLQSSNGTRVNGCRVKQIALHHGDRIECGDTIFEVLMSPRDADPAATIDVPKKPARRAPAGMPLESASERVRFADFEITRELGRGGMGVVYHAVQRKTEREVALKIVQADEDAVTPEAFQLFLREASILSQLHHPRIVKYFSVGMYKRQMFLAMEYVPVMDALQIITSQSRPKQIRVACGLICRVLEGLEHAHQQGIVHRDVKPQNILAYKQDGRLQVKLADFGLAKSYTSAGFTSITHDGVFRGTLGFTAPEQLINYRYARPPCDIYAAGACLYYFLCRKMPCDTGDMGSAIAAVLDSGPRPLTELAPDVPPELAALVHRALARESGERFATAESMRGALQKFSEK